MGIAIRLKISDSDPADHLEANLSLNKQPIYIVPEKTAEIARAIFPDGNLYMKLFDTFGSLFSDQDFEQVFPDNGQPAFSPVRLMLVLILQFIESLSDRLAADAVRTRIDWKYLLFLEITNPGFDYSILSEFRTRLLENEWEQKLFDRLLVRFLESGYIKKYGQQRTDSTIVPGAMRDLNRLEMVGETMRHVLDSLAVVALDWLLDYIQSTWVDLYGSQVQNYRLSTSQEKRDALADQIGADGLFFLNAIWCPSGR